MKTLRRLKSLALVLAIALLTPALLLGCGKKSSGTIGGTIKIGAIIPLTGSQASIGEEEQRGLQMAMDKLKGRQILGKKVEIKVEDDKSDPTSGVSAVEKLLTKDQVWALIGGYSSTTSYSIMGAIRNRQPLTVWSGGGSVKLEDDFGKEKWFFHLHPWDYHYQESIGQFVGTINPKPQSIAIAYEDQLYGTSHAKIAKPILEQLGLKVVLYEPFKSGATDYTPLLTKVKNLNPDVFYWIGYTGDSILLTRQAKEIGLNPKMMMDTVGVGVPDYRKAVGSNAEGVVGIEVWSPAATFPASDKYAQDFPSTETWVKEYTQRYNREPNYWSLITYVNALVLTQAIERAGSLDKEKVIAELEKTDTMTPMGPLTFFKTKVAIHQGYTKMVVFQWQNGSKQILWPKATGQLIYPKPAWK